MAIQAVTPDLREYTIALSAFAPETYCGPLGRPISDVAQAAQMLEVSDASISSNARPVNFDVGNVQLLP